MTTPPTPTTHKLILVVLTLILVCLGLLVVRAYRPGQASSSAEPIPSPAPEIIAETPEPQPAPRPTVASRPVPANRPAVQPAQAALPVVQVAAAPAVPVLTPVPVVATPVETQPETAVPAESAPGYGTVQYNLASGYIAGRVELIGPVPSETPIALGPTCSPATPEPPTTRHYVVGESGALANVLVFVHRSSTQNESWAGDDKLVAQTLPDFAPTLKDDLVLDQVGCMFDRYVSAMQLSQKLVVRNSDNTLHNVHLTPRVNREVNIGQPLRGQVNTFQFSKPESFLRIKCDVHPWMFSYVSVLPHRYFSVTDTNGVFQIPQGLPPGTYQLTARHLKAGRITRTIRLKAKGDVLENFGFTAPEAIRPNSVVDTKR